MQEPAAAGSAPRYGGSWTRRRRRLDPARSERRRPLATSLTVDGVPDGAAVKDSKTFGGASVGGGAIWSCTPLGGKQWQAALTPGSRGEPYIPTPVRQGELTPGSMRPCSFSFPLSLTYLVLSLSADVAMGGAETRGHGGEQGRREIWHRQAPSPQVSLSSPLNASLLFGLSLTFSLSPDRTTHEPAGTRSA
jgi:hypothetical protein